MMRNKKYGTFSLLVLILFFMGFSRAHGQSFDYSLHPKLDFSYNHLTLELNVITEQQLLEGRAEYQLEANIGGVDSLILQAAHMDIEDVRIDGEPAEFRLGNDSLFIGLNSPTETGQSYNLEVLYKTSPKFGVHFETGGRVWSSFLPLTTRHWVPVMDHPRVTFTTDITLSVPGNYSALAPGKLISEEISSVEEKQVRWESRRSIPASALWFVTGPFTTEETSLGIKKVIVSENSENESGQNLLEMSYRVLNRAEERLGVEFPFESLNVIVLDDHRWETKPYGAGVIYIFANRGAYESQLRRGIYAQWYGVHQREEQWSDAEAINLFQTAAHYSGGGEGEIVLSDTMNPAVSVNPYHAFSPRQWNRWQQFYPEWKDTTWKNIVEQSVTALLSEDGGTRSWNDFARAWYRESGQPWFNPPNLTVEDDHVSTPKDSITYRVNYHLNEGEGRLALAFEAVDSVINELVSLALVQHFSDKTDTVEVTFTGESDSVLVNLDPSVSYVTMSSPSRDNLFLEEKKPVSFILSQLRSSESPETKAFAARQLAKHADNPDLQLAISDMLSRELEPRVRGALLYSLGEITRGASGTEQVFLDALRQEDPAIQKAAIGALGHYRENEQVIQALQQYALKTENLSTLRFALESLEQAADSASFKQFSQQVMDSDSTGHKAILVLQHVSDHESVVSKLDILVGSDYSYSVRSRALRRLARIDQNGERWESRFNNMSSDPDPRIRLLAVQAIKKINLVDAQSLVQERILDEYDGRVYYEMRQLLDRDS